MSRFLVLSVVLSVDAPDGIFLSPFEIDHVLSDRLMQRFSNGSRLEELRELSLLSVEINR